ncbi:hypothetical protein [Halococcus sediminicola]|uniref:hypothetical protein n=1 Tax=Halococcus sediminicola TaxID=1264579 RepID=UPI0006790382|nr:hypothetical protein [Halococcus sediminicola]
MEIDAFGRIVDADVPTAIQCAVCRGTADRLSSAWQGEGIAYHNYQCQAEGCPATGTIVDHDSGGYRRIGPVFGDRDLAVHLATREQSETPVETVESRV